MSIEAMSCALSGVLWYWPCCRFFDYLFKLRDKDRFWRGLLSQCTRARVNRKSNPGAARPRDWMYCSHKPRITDISTICHAPGHANKKSKPASLVLCKVNLSPGDRWIPIPKGQQFRSRHHEFSTQKMRNEKRAFTGMHYHGTTTKSRCLLMRQRRVTIISLQEIVSLTGI